jgi:hypothetical protein
MALLLAVLASGEQPKVTSIDPLQVRAGGAFIVNVEDVGDGISITVYNERLRQLLPPIVPPMTILDNQDGDDAPQKGRIQYRIQTDFSWLTTIGHEAKSLAGVEERFVISVSQIVRAVAPELAAPSRPSSLQSQPTFKSSEISRTVSVLAGTLLDQQVLLDEDFARLAATALYLRLLADASDPDGKWAAMTKAGASPSMAIQDSLRSYSANADPKVTQPLDTYLTSLFYEDIGHMSTSAGQIDGLRSALLSILRRRYPQLREVSERYETLVATEHRTEHYAERLAFLRQQLGAIEKACC